MKKLAFWWCAVFLAACSGQGPTSLPQAAPIAAAPVAPPGTTTLRKHNVAITGYSSGGFSLIQGNAGYASNVASGTANVCVTAPCSVTAGDALLMFVTWNTAATLTTPTGWTLLGTASYTPTYNEKTAAFVRIADATDTGSTPLSFSASGSYTYAYEEFSGVDATTPTEGFIAATQHLTSVSITSGTPSAADLPVAAFGVRQTNTQPTGLGAGYTQDSFLTPGNVYMETQHGALTSSAATAQLTWALQAYTTEVIVLLRPASATATPSPTPTPTATPTPIPTPVPTPTPTPNGATPLWEAGAPGSQGAWVVANTYQCGTPVVSGNQFTMNLTKSGTSCGRNMANPDPNGSGEMTLTDGQIYTFKFHYIDGTPLDAAPGMGLDTGSDPESLIWQIHGLNEGDTPCTSLDFVGGQYYTGQPSGQEWAFFDCNHQYGSGSAVWFGSYTPQEQDDFTIVVQIANDNLGEKGLVKLYRNGVLVATDSSGTFHNSTSSPPQAWWNFGPYKWRWELSSPNSSMTQVNATFNDMRVYAGDQSP